MIIEPKLLSTAALHAIVMDFEESAPARSPRSYTQCLLEHIAALQAALDLERRHRAEDRDEAMQTYDTMTAQLAEQTDRIIALAEAEEHANTWRTRAQTIEARTVAAIAAWLRDRQERPDLALLVEAGVWRATKEGPTT